ncbi:MAG: GTPase domain-containing protein [Desulfobacter sp.]
MDCSESLPRVLVIGKESVGKSQLVASLTGRWAESYNFPGSTVACDCYPDAFYNYIDTPGLLRRSDSDACRETLAALAENERVLLVVNATHIDQDLEDLLGLVEDKHGAVVVTFWDKVARIPGAEERLAELSRRAAIPIIPVDARQLSETHRQGIRRAVGERRKFPLPPFPRGPGGQWSLRVPRSTHR